MLKRFKTFFKYYSRNKIAVFALGILILIILAAIFADFIAPTTTQNSSQKTTS